MDDKETTLESVPGIPAKVIRLLKKRWISSVEQLVALGASPPNVKSLAAELGIDEAQTLTILRAARGALDPATAAALERPVDTSRYPLGARKPRRSPPDRDA